MTKFGDGDNTYSRLPSVSLFDMEAQISVPISSRISNFRHSMAREAALL